MQLASVPKLLTCSEDAEAEPMPRMLREASWMAIKKRITAEVQRLSL